VEVTFEGVRAIRLLLVYDAVLTPSVNCLLFMEGPVM